MLLLLSGGSALAPLRLLPEPPSATIAALDDRVSDDPAVSNYLQLVEAGMRPGFDSRPRPGEPREAVAARFDAFLRGWRQAHPEGRVVITQGIGPDGHTAGIFPLAAASFSALYDGAWAVSHAHGAPYPERVTVTPGFLVDQVDASLLYVGGENKREALARALDPTSRPHEVPAAVIQRMRDVRLVTDLT